MTVDDLELPAKCPRCGTVAEEWTENEGRGVISGGLVYCSDACALEDAAGQQED
jgi:endogenous inhibitor of DNA gyrase (YacG/DUF329 family)